MRFNVKGRCLDIDREIRPTGGARDFIINLKDYSSFISRFLLKNNLNGVREIRINLTYSKY